jgi:glycosyltransferase involved in cell wall biosynthesis
MVSICLLTYNHELYIRQCMESILMQEMPFEFEIIIADDCSTDKNILILDEYTKQFPEKVRIVLQPHNKGVMANVISMLKEAKGKYIAICEGDDYWIDNQKLVKQLALLEQHPNYSMVCTNRYILQQNGEKVPDNAYSKEVYTISDIITGFIPGTQTIMFRNYSLLPDFLERYQQYYSGDRYIAYFCSLFGDIYRLKDYTAVYRVTETGIWAKRTALEKLKLTFEQIVEFHRSVGIPVNNVIAAKKGFSVSLNFFLYAVKRPFMLTQKQNWQFILSPWRLFKYMNRLNFMAAAVADRIQFKNK